MLADYNAAVLALSGIQNYWPLSEADGATTSFVDSQSANTAVAATAPGATTGPDGAASAPNFAATANKVLVPSSVSMPTSHTVGYWMKLNSQAQADNLSFEWATAAFAKFVQHDIGSTATISGSSGKSVFSASYGVVASGTSERVVRVTEYPNAAWRFVCCTMDVSLNNTHELFVYTSAVHTGVQTGLAASSHQTQAAGAGTVGIGGRGQAGRALPLDGALQGLFIVNAILTTTQMGDLMTAMAATRAAPPRRQGHRGLVMRGTHRSR